MHKGTRSYNQHNDIVPIKNIATMPDHTKVCISCNLYNIKEILTKSGSLMCFATAEDMSGSIEVVVFADVYSEVSNVLKSEVSFQLVGMVERGEDEDKLLITKNLSDNAGLIFSGHVIPNDTLIG